MRIREYQKFPVVVDITPRDFPSSGKNAVKVDYGAFADAALQEFSANAYNIRIGIIDGQTRAFITCQLVVGETMDDMEAKRTRLLERFETKWLSPSTRSERLQSEVFKLRAKLEERDDQPRQGQGVA